NEKKGYIFKNGATYKDLESLKEDFEIEKNYHAHITFSGLRSNGLSIRDYSAKEVKNKEVKSYNQYFMQNFCINSQKKLQRHLFE
ncbi:hypothetical protein LZC35_08830, partial [Campylobacter jejuni]